jgi:glycosyltransferase involved in cell wall biosynthesis
MKVNFVISGVGRDRFSAGHLVIMEHAHELARRGHEVTVVPTMASYTPRWFDVQVALVPGTRMRPAGAIADSARAFSRYLRDRRRRADLVAGFTALTREVAGHATLPYRVAAMSDRLRRVIPEADVTLATGFSTVLPVWLSGTGALGYFMQHHEVLFAAETDDPQTNERLAELSYRLPLHRIANCTWLAREIMSQYGGDPPALCLNAIDHDRYYPDGSPPKGPLTVVSYSGRRAPWKDLHTAAQAIRLAREKVPDLRWIVYGSEGLISPDNDIAPYEAAGFMNADQLRSLYSRAHIALSASWYESFPLPPLEAMACGCAVVTTRLGTEDYARDGENSRVVEARDAGAMARAIVDLWCDPALRARLSTQAQEDAAAFTWSRSGDQFEQALTAILAAETSRQGSAGR